MAKPLSQTDSSELVVTNEQGSSPECYASSDIVAQLTTIESRLAELAGSRSTGPEDESGLGSTDARHGIQSVLQRQGDLLHTLTEGLEQFEDRLSDRLIQVLRESHAGPDSSPRNNTSTPEQDTSATDSDGPVLSQASPKPVDESWDAIRRAMMESAVEDPAEEQAEDVSVADTSDAGTVDGVVEATTSPESGGTIEPVHFDIPEPIDAAQITDTNLRDAVLAREDIMRVMASRLRQRIELSAPISTEQLRELADDLPGAFRDQVQNTLALLDGQLRLTELELSLERARLGRQMSQLEASHAAIRSTARQLGCTVLDDGTLEGTVPTSENTRRGRRWMRVLGFGR